MHKVLYKALVALVIVGLSACSTVTIKNEGTRAIATKPNYEESFDFYFWGLTPHHRTVELSHLCDNAQVKQLQVQDTFLDGLLTGITLGIYRPRTARVWCE